MDRVYTESSGFMRSAGELQGRLDTTNESPAERPMRPASTSATRHCSSTFESSAPRRTAPTHSHPKIKAWLARPRWHMHFIPTCSSWLNQVERFFALITDKAIRRGSFTSVKQLVQRIGHFVDSYNEKCQPFKWTATADSILEKLHRLCSRMTGTAQ